MFSLIIRAWTSTLAWRDAAGGPGRAGSRIVTRPVRPDDAGRLSAHDTAASESFQVAEACTLYSRVAEACTLYSRGGRGLYSGVAEVCTPGWPRSVLRSGRGLYSGVAEVCTTGWPRSVLQGS